MSQATEAAFEGVGDPTLTAAGTAAPPSIFRNRNFMFLWIAQMLTQTAQNAIFYGLIVYIEATSNSSTETGILILTTIVPAILFGIAAGVYVDRADKRNVLVICNAVRGVSVLVYPFAADARWLIFAVNFLFSIITQFFGPAEAATIPRVVRRDQLLMANGVFNLTFTGSQLAGFVVLGPPLVKLFGPTTLFIAIAVAYFIATVLCLLLPPQKSIVTTSGSSVQVLESVLKEVRDGIRLLGHNRAVRLSLVFLTLAATLMLVTGMLAPGFVNRVLGIKAEDAVFVMAPAGIGIALGAVVLPRLGNRVSRFDLINVGLVSMTISLIVLGFVREIWLWAMHTLGGFPPGVEPTDKFSLIVAVMVIAFVLGMAFALVNVPAQTALMENAPDAMRGKLFAVQLVFSSLVSVLPLLFLGQLADRIGISQVVVLLGVLIGGLTVYSYWQTRDLRGLSAPADEKVVVK